MSQLWNRIRRIAQSYIHDSPFSHSYETLEEEDQRRLKEIIDQLNRRPPQQEQASAGRSERREQQRRQARPQGMTTESALAVLGLPPTAGTDEIRRAYKQLMLKYHPDRVATLGATEQEAAHRRAREINAAYQFIKKHRNL